MKQWKEVRNDEALWARIAGSPQKALILDYDGTLAPFVQDRNQAVPYPGVREIVSKIMRRPGSRVVFVTGRACEDLLSLLDLPVCPEVWGSHGGERLLPDGTLEKASLGPEHARGLASAREKAGSLGDERLEEKPGCVAAHFRGLDEHRAGKLKQEIFAAWSGTAKESGLTLHEFDGGLELRVPGADKGRAVRKILEETGHGAVVFYLGDDTTDEDAFLALKGKGTPVLVRKEPRPTQAEWLLKPPEELLEFLSQWDAALA
ncbi:MAG: trehalose-phosphatase [Thermodesulfobacteriota bacterium]|nr:trehalose-phosphatase [Thermodesulfobacteriota bacterium]